MNAIQAWVENCGAGEAYAREFEGLIEMVNGLTDVKVVLEIGSFQGRSLAVWREAFEPELLIGVELEPHHVSDSSEAYVEVGAHVICGRSQDPDTVRRVLDALKGRQVDFLYLDADHTYNAEMQDIAIYGPLVRPGGVMVLDDAMMEIAARELGVPTDVYRIIEEMPGGFIVSGDPEPTVEGLLAGQCPPGKYVLVR